MKTITLESERDYLIYREGSGGTIEIFDLAVQTERGVGKGRKLIEKLIAEIPNDVRLVFAITRDNNGIAREFYRAVGFNMIGVLRGFYPVSDGFQNAIMYGYRR